MIPLWVKLALVGALCAFAAAYHVFEVNRAFGRGQIAERVAWQDQRLRDIAKREAERKQAETQIAKIEAEYLAKQRSTQATLADLEKALADEQADNPACPPALSRKLRDQLQGIR